MYCNQCGKALPDGTAFCTECGADLSARSAANPQTVNYTMPPPQPIYSDMPLEPAMSVKDWVITMLLMMIPIANIVFLIVWAVGDGCGLTKRNWARAQLILTAISTGFVIILYIFIFVIIGYSYLTFR
jgi:hypothetical protein